MSSNFRSADPKKLSLRRKRGHRRGESTGSAFLSLFRDDQKKKVDLEIEEMDVEAIANEERTSRTLYSAKAPAALTDSWPMYEHFLVIGAPRDHEFSKKHIENVDPHILFTYPPNCEKRMMFGNIEQLCFPGGVRIRNAENHSTMRSSGGHILRPHNSFVFLMSTESGETYYGICTHVERLHAEFNPHQSSGKTAVEYYFTPVCFCLVSRYPFFPMHFEVLKRLFGLDDITSLFSNYEGSCAAVRRIIRKEERWRLPNPPTFGPPSGVLDLFERSVESEKSEHRSEESSVALSSSAPATSVLSDTATSTDLHRRGSADVPRTTESGREDSSSVNDEELQFRMSQDHRNGENSGSRASLSDRDADIHSRRDSQSDTGSTTTATTTNDGDDEPDELILLESNDLESSSEDSNVQSSSSTSTTTSIKPTPLILTELPTPPTSVVESDVVGESGVVTSSAVLSALSPRGSNVSSVRQRALVMLGADDESVNDESLGDPWEGLVDKTDNAKRTLMRAICALEYYRNLQCPRPSKYVSFSPFPRWLAGRPSSTPRKSPLFEEVYFKRPSNDDEEALLAAYTLPITFNMLGRSALFTLISCVLLEKRVIIVAPYMRVLSSIVLSFIPLIRPFRYQSVVVPLLPPCMYSILDAPVPFLVGMLESPDRRTIANDIVVIDVVRGEIHGHANVPPLPSKDILRKRLSPYLKDIEKQYPRYTRSDKQIPYDVSKTDLLAKYEMMSTVFESHLSGLLANFRKHCIRDLTDRHNPITVFVKESFLCDVKQVDFDFFRQFLETQLFFQYSDRLLRREDAAPPSPRATPKLRGSAPTDNRAPPLSLSERSHSTSSLLNVNKSEKTDKAGGSVIVKRTRKVSISEPSLESK